MDIDKLPTWNYEMPECEPINDENERPPLKGKTVKVPEGLYDQPWSQVHDAYGPATLTPYYIEALGSMDEGDRDFAAYGLYAATTHQGAVYESSQMAIPFLVDMLEAEEKHDFIIASVFLARIAVGENNFIQTPNDINDAKSIYFNDVFKYIDRLTDFYNATGNEEIMRLLCFYPGVLPDYITLDSKTPELQASKLIVQGFLATERNLKEHIDNVKLLMHHSPSLLVRGAAAICLAYSKHADQDVMQLLKHLAMQEFKYTPWSWDTIQDMCKAAWLYAADMNTLLQCKNNDFNSINTISCLREALKRVFPRRNMPYLPHELSTIQKNILSHIIASHNECNIPSYETESLGLSSNKKVLLRLLEQSNELLCTNVSIYKNELKGEPLWYSLEMYLQPESHLTEERMCKVICKVDVWKLISEVFAPINPEDITERCTISLKSHFGDGIKEKKEAKLISLFANAMHNRTDEMFEFLNEWLEKVIKFEDDYDWAFKTPSQRIAIALLGIARKGLLSSKYYPMVRTYHKYPQHSTIPLPIVAELLSHTSEEHQQSIAGNLNLYHKDKDEETGITKLTIDDVAWNLLKGCHGKWVVEKVLKAAEVWKQVGIKYETDDIFPYNKAISILIHNKIDKELHYHLPRF